MPVNWVLDRVKCNADRLFGELRVQVAHDVVAAVAANVEASFSEERPDLFVVTAGRQRVEFRLAGARIEGGTVEPGLRPLRARAEFDRDSGECRLRMDRDATNGGALLQPWEFAREVLEDVLFPPS